MSHSEGLVSEYKAQLERSRSQCEELTKELRLKDQEVDQLKRENMIEIEKVELACLTVI